jgi:hypothetical protein
MNINFIIVNNTEYIANFNPEEVKKRTGWMTNCYNEIWYAYITDKMNADLMEKSFSMLHEDEANEKTVGGGKTEINPINSSKTIWVNSDYTVVIGHYHAMVQMLKLDSYKQMISNIHLIKSTVWGLDNVSLLGIMAKHLGLRVREITS